ncbi:hypothetical protein KRR40_47435 [Niabella defluvii]|nr:hypothetical protein KRR40_47435 [Niabella sp. I65]
MVTEAEKLVRMGVKEVMLIAQELTYYGLDIYKNGCCLSSCTAWQM